MIRSLTLEQQGEKCWLPVNSSQYCQLPGAEMWGKFQGAIKPVFWELNFCVKGVSLWVSPSVSSYICTWGNAFIMTMELKQDFQEQFLHSECVTALTYNEIP